MEKINLNIITNINTEANQKYTEKQKNTIGKAIH